MDQAANLQVADEAPILGRDLNDRCRTKPGI